MRAARGVVVPSVWFETASLVYLESIAVGTPVLAFEPNIVAEFVSRDGTGSVARWGHVAADVAHAADAFPALRERCRSVYLDKHSEGRFVAERVALYESVARR
jgi:glycosyltransferase involved in cell wall biosynthesis